MTYQRDEAIAGALACVVGAIDPTGQSSRRAASAIRALAENQEADADGFLHLLADVLAYSATDKACANQRMKG